jgi:hypothetical protein
MVLALATCEPYNTFIHSGINYDGYIVIYSYTVDEFYEDEWKEEIYIYMKHLFSCLRRNNITHDTIKNYNIMIRTFNRMQLVEIFTDDTNREICILHTYKINIFKKIWKKYFYNKIKNSLKLLNNNNISLSKL